MIFTLSILISICLILAVYRLYRQYHHHQLAMRCWAKDIDRVARLKFDDLYDKYEGLQRRIEKTKGQVAKSHISAKIAEKTADRAFTLASSANLGVVALQKTLQTPRLVNKEQAQRNQLAKNDIDKLFSTENGNLDWLKPILSDEDLEIVEKAEEYARKMKETNGA